MTSVVAKLYDATGAQIAELPDFADVQIQDKLSDPGSWTMKYDRGGRNFDLLIQDQDLSIKFFVDGDEIYEGVIEEDNWDETAEDGAVTLAGRNWAGQFEFAKVYPQGGVTAVNEGWKFTNASPGNIFYSLLVAAHGRGTVPDLTVDFTTSLDSNGQPWANTQSITIKTGVSLLDIITNFGKAGYADWRMNGKVLSMYNPRTVLGEQSGVTFRRSRDIKSAPRSRSRRKLGTVYLVGGDDNKAVERVDASAVAARGRKEQFVSQGGVTDTGTLNVVGDLNLAVFADNRLSKTHTLVFSDDVVDLLNPNYNFETDLTGWQGLNATITREATPGTVPFSGSWSMKIVPDGVGQFPRAESDQLPVLPGKAYRIQGYQMCETSRSVDLNLNWYDASHAYVATSTVSHTMVAGAWQEFDGTFVCPAGCAYVSIDPTVPNFPPATDVLWSDEIVLTHTTELPKPWRDYIPGLYVDTDLTGDVENYRLVAMTVTMGTDGFLNGEITLNDVFEEREILLDDAITTLTGGSSGAGSNPPTTAKDTTIPDAPTGLNGLSNVYLSGRGVQWAQATLNWAAVITNTDGTTIDDFDRYEINWWYTDEPSIVHFLNASDNLVNISGLIPAKNFTYKVRAWDSNAHKSAFSAEYAFDLDSDTTPPPVPSAPVVANYLGLLRATWDGLGSAGEIMPLDFRYAEVWYSTVNDFTPGDVGSVLADILPAKGSANISGLTYGTTYYVKLRSVDEDDNISAASVQGSGTPQQVVQTDIGNNVIDFSNIRFKDVGNLVPDGSFELATTAQIINTAVFDVVTNPLGATAAPSPKVLRCKTGTATYTVNSGVSVSPDEKYAMVYSYMGSGLAGADSVKLRLHFTLRDGTTTDVDYKTFNSTTNGATFTLRQSVYNSVPANAVSMDVQVVVSIATAGAFLYLDEWEVRQQAGTVLIADAAVTNALIANLAVNNAKIADVSAGKLTVGTLTADITLSARIKTADTGARVEINSGGIGAWNSSGTQTVSIAGADGSVTIVGQLKSGVSGQRIEINPTSTFLPEIRFYPSTGSNYGFLNAFSPAGSAYAYVGLNSGQFTANSQTCVYRLYMTDTACTLETIRSDTQVTLGGAWKISPDYASGWVITTTQRQGYIDLYGGGGQGTHNLGLSLGHNGTSDNDDAFFNVYKDGSFDMVGTWVRSVGWANSAVQNDTDSSSSAIAGFLWNWGTTQNSTIYPSDTYRDSPAHATSVDTLSTTGYGLNIDGGSSGACAHNFWGWR